MKHIFFYVICVFSLFSCFKKSNEIPNFTTNFFDEDYTGDIWFESAGYTELMTYDSISFIRYKFNIKEELKPPSSGGNFTNTAPILILHNGIGVNRSPNNIYSDVFDLTIGTINCFKIGVIDENGIIINQFEECVKYDG